MLLCYQYLIASPDVDSLMAELCVLLVINVLCATRAMKSGMKLGFLEN